MMERLGLAGPWSRIPERVRRVLFPLLVLVLLIFYPSYYSNITSAIGTTSTAAQLVPTVGTMVIMTVYVVMALGLNVVVGYAGLLDLGYVAFYAAGAYIAGWFATQQFAPHSVHIFSVRGAGHAPRAAHQRLGAARRGGGVRGALRDRHRRCRPCACAATTWPSSPSASARSCPRR